MLNTRNLIRIGALVGFILPAYTLPTSPVTQVVLNYSGLGLGASGVDKLLNDLYSTGYATDCIIDVTNNSIPTAASAAAITGLEADLNTVLRDSA